MQTKSIEKDDQEIHGTFKNATDYTMARIAWELGGSMNADIGWMGAINYCIACLQCGPEWWRWDPWVKQPMFKFVSRGFWEHMQQSWSTKEVYSQKPEETSKEQTPAGKKRKQNATETAKAKEPQKKQGVPKSVIGAAKNTKALMAMCKAQADVLHQQIRSNADWQWASGQLPALEQASSAMNQGLEEDSDFAMILSTDDLGKLAKTSAWKDKMEELVQKLVTFSTQLDPLITDLQMQCKFLLNQKAVRHSTTADLGKAKKTHKAQKP